MTQYTNWLQNDIILDNDKDWSPTLQDCEKILKTVDSYSLHKKIRVSKYNPGFSKYRRQQTQSDLVEIQKLANKKGGFQYLLTGIDTFILFGFCEPFKNKK